MVTSEGVADQYRAERDWNDARMVELMHQFIDEAGLAERFGDWLEEEAQRERAEVEDEGEDEGSSWAEHNATPAELGRLAELVAAADLNLEVDCCNADYDLHELVAAALTRGPAWAAAHAATGTWVGVSEGAVLRVWGQLLGMRPRRDRVRLTGRCGDPWFVRGFVRGAVEARKV